jgi:hypothetical protein
VACDVGNYCSYAPTRINWLWRAPEIQDNFELQLINQSTKIPSPLANSPSICASLLYFQQLS